MQFQVCESDDSCNQGHSTRTREWWSSTTARRLNCSGLVLVRQLIERSEWRAIDAGARVLQRCKWYRESDHILTLPA